MQFFVRSPGELRLTSRLCCWITRIEKEPSQLTTLVVTRYKTNSIGVLRRNIWKVRGLLLLEPRICNIDILGGPEASLNQKQGLDSNNFVSTRSHTSIVCFLNKTDILLFLNDNQNLFVFSQLFKTYYLGNQLSTSAPFSTGCLDFQDQSATQEIRYLLSILTDKLRCTRVDSYL